MAHKAKHWIHISSASVYSAYEDRAHSETDLIGGAPIWGEYGEQKSEIDSYLISSIHKGRVTILRPPYIYGAGNDSDRETFVWARCRRKEPIFVPKDGNIPMQFVSADDLAAITHQLHLANPVGGIEVYNVGNPSVISQIDWVKTVAKSAGYQAQIIPLANVSHNSISFAARSHFPFRDYPCCLNTEKLSKRLANFKYTSFEECLAEIYEGTSLALLDQGSSPSDIEESLLNTQK